MAALALLLVAVSVTPLAAQPLPVQLQGTAEAEKKNAAPADDAGQQSLEALLAPMVERLVQERLAAERAAAAEEPAAASAAAASSGDPFARLIDAARMGVEGLALGIRETFGVVPELGEHIDRAFILLTDLEGWPRMWEGLANLAAMFVAGVVAALAARRLFARILPVPPTAPERPLARLAVSAVVLVRDLVLVAIFALLAFLVSLAWFAQHDPMRIFLIANLGAAATACAGAALAGFLFAPGRPGHRLIESDEESASRLALWAIVLFATVGVVGFSVGMIRLLGMPTAVFHLLELAAGLFVAGVTAVLILSTAADHPPAADESSNGARRLLDTLFGRYRRAWLLVAAAVVLLFWTMCVLSGDDTRVGAVVIGSGALLAALYLGHLRTPPAPAVSAYDLARAQAAIPVDPEDRADFPAPPPQAPEPPRPSLNILPSFRQVVQAALTVVVALALLHVLGVDMVRALETDTGRRAGLVLLDVAIILLVASVCWALVQRTINRFIEHERERALAETPEQTVDEDGLGGMVTSRFGTLLPLIRGFILSVLVAVTIMVVLSSMGIDIGPLLAGAGVVGIAIGFGAQALVRDIISGIFFLIDDAFRVGEYVEFGELRGQVEQISIRSMRLRHHRGAIHTVPFGELRSITNYNRDWAIYKQEFRLPYQTDTEQVRKIIKKVGQKLMADPELGSKFIQPLKSQGVFRIDEGALILRTKFMCKPREQFVIRKAVFQEVKNALYAAGIELAQRRVQIEWPEWVDGGEGGKAEERPAARLAAGAAGGAAGLVVAHGVKKPAYPDEP